MFNSCHTHMGFDLSLLPLFLFPYFFLKARCENVCLLITIYFVAHPLAHVKSRFFYCTMFAILALRLLTLVETIHRCDKLILPCSFIVLCNQWYCVETLVESRGRVGWGAKWWMAWGRSMLTLLAVVWHSGHDHVLSQRRTALEWITPVC